MSTEITIAIVCSASATKRLFTPSALERLRAIGKLIVNPDECEPTPERVIDLAQNADVVITSWGSPNIDKTVMHKLTNIKLLAHAAGSVKPIVSDAMWNRGVRVISSAMVLGKGVAETALGYTVAAIKNLFNVTRTIAEGGWDETFDDIREMFELKIGVIGGGMAGAHYMRLLSMFDVELLLYDPYISPEKAREDFNASSVSLEELLAASDVISIHAPSIPETYHMFNAETLTLLKKDAIIINTARGTLIDEEALYCHMLAGNMKYACLDVFDPEPPAVDNKLRTLPNCIMSPHLAGLTHNGLLRIGAHCASEVERFFQNKPLITEVTKDQLVKNA